MADPEDWSHIHTLCRIPIHREVATICSGYPTEVNTLARILAWLNTLNCVGKDDKRPLREELLTGYYWHVGELDE